jgi:hypothetical protein
MSVMLLESTQTAPDHDRSGRFALSHTSRHEQLTYQRERYTYPDPLVHAPRVASHECG